METLTKFRDQFATTWRGMPRWQQAGIGVVGMFSLIFMLAVGWNASRQDFAVLFAQLAPEDANAIVNKLKTKSVSYKLSDDGTAVFVSSDQVAPLRIEFLAEDLPSKGGRGFELFDHTNLSATPFTNNINYVRALQGELAKTIMQIDPIVQARVHIVRPETSPFLRGDLKPASASIVVKLRPGGTLTRKTGAGIVALVSRSVEGLSKENVTILDTTGRQISEGLSSEDAAASQMDSKRDLETYLAKNAEEMLAKALGPGKAVVRVTADLNHKSLKEHREIYDPESRATKKETTTQRKDNGSTSKGGVAGTGGVVAKLAGGSGAQSSSQEDTTIEYSVSKKIFEIEEKLGGVLRLTVACMVDLNEGDGSDGKKRMSLNSVQETIKKAIGYKDDRDEIYVAEAKFQPAVPTDLAEDDSAEIRKWNRIATMVRDVSIGFTAVTLVVLVYSMVRRRKQSQIEAAQTANSASPAGEASEDARMMERLAETFRSNPDVLSKVLADWLEQGETRIKAT